MEEYICNSVSDLLCQIPTDVDDDEILFFRGHASKEFEITPSIYRKQQWYSNEDRIIREILTRCPNDFISMNSSFEKLVKMQHYDLPTRLLDISGNALVALYFSCGDDNQKNNDGEVLFFKIPKSEVKYFDSDTVSVVSNLAWSKSDFEISDRFSGKNKEFHHKDNVHAHKLMHDIRREKPHFLERINSKHLESVLCVKPKHDNPRIMRQDGVFFLFGIKGNKFSPAKIPKDWLFYPNQKKIIIKKENKLNILKQLSNIGISKAQLFPEIDTVSQFIKNDFGLNKGEFKSSIKSYSPAKIHVDFT